MAFFMSTDQLAYYIALGQIPGVGNIIAKNLVAYVGSAEGIFREKRQNLLKIPKVGPVLADAICNAQTLERAREEMEFIAKNNISAIPYTSDAYPYRLKECEDAPVVLFTKGNGELNAKKSVAIVGTRNATSYGKEMCKILVQGLKKHDAIVVSGLAFGVDIYSHRFALENELQTVAVLGHALDTVYPAEHRQTAQQIEQHGALVSEYCSKTPIDKSNFVTRNRIIAGLADGVVIVESGEKGGALITAEYANSYNRDVFAFPGKSTDKYSRGCNNLIKKNKAALIESVEDLEYMLNWQLDQPDKTPRQANLLFDLSPEESLIMETLSKESMLNIDIISLRCNLPMSRISTLLLNLEFNGLVKNHPGKLYSRT